MCIRFMVADLKSDFGLSAGERLQANVLDYFVTYL